MHVKLEAEKTSRRRRHVTAVSGEALSAAERTATFEFVGRWSAGGAAAGRAA